MSNDALHHILGPVLQPEKKNKAEKKAGQTGRLVANITPSVHLEIIIGKFLFHIFAYYLCG